MGLHSESISPATASLAPGFRFHPTDEELVRYYLRRKVCGKPFRFDAISEIDIYNSEPWDLPGKSRLKSRDLEWYFFSVLDKKYGNGWKTNRATERGYWKTTGKDRPVFHKSRTIGMKKTLVYHIGRAPRGERTNWVMHEYKLVDEELQKAGIAQDAFVLCRIFEKSGSGPKNGEQYGAPFIEEEWEDDELIMIPGEEISEEAVMEDDDYLDGNDLEQILNADAPLEDVPLPLSFYYEDDTGCGQEQLAFVDHDPKPLVDAGESYHASEHPDTQQLFELPVQNDMDTKAVKHEYIGEPSNAVNSADTDYLVDEPFLDTINNTPFDDGAFLEANDLSNSIEVDPSSFGMLEEYLAFLGAEDDKSQFIGSDSLKMMGNENVDASQESLTQKCVDGEAQQDTMGSQQLLQGQDNNVPSTSEQDPGNSGLDIQYPFLKQASCTLGSISAPPAFASEFPSKDAAIRLNSTSHSSSSIHVTAGMVQITNLTSSGDSTYLSLGKHADVSFILSFCVSHEDVDYACTKPVAGVLVGKAGSVISSGWFYLMFIWVLVLTVSLKIGPCIYTGNAS